MGPILTQILPGAVWSEALLDAEAALGLSPQPMRRLASLNAASVERLRLSNAEQSHLKKVGLARNLAVHEVAYRFGEDVALDSVAIDLVVDRPPAALREEIGQSAATTFPVMAKDLMDLGMKPGPELGATLKELEAQWIAKRFAPSRETLLSSLLLGS
jgi:poly(A) polymerase